MNAIPGEAAALAAASSCFIEGFVLVEERLGSPDAGQDAAVKRLEAAGMPVVRIALRDVFDLGQEFTCTLFGVGVTTLLDQARESLQR